MNESNSTLVIPQSIILSYDSLIKNGCDMFFGKLLVPGNSSILKTLSL
jgi:hypothetical protein